MEYLENFKKQVLALVKDMLIDMGYLANDNSMKIYSGIFETTLNTIKDTFMAAFTVNDDYNIYVRIVNECPVLRCGLQIVSDDVPYHDFTDDTFDIVLTK